MTSNNILHGKVGELIRKIAQLESEVEELRSDYILCFVTKMDIPDRSVLAKVLTPNGLKEMVLRTTHDSLALQILEEYNKGKSRFTFRLTAGFISQIMPDDMFPNQMEELSELLNKPVITSQLSEDDNVTSLDRDIRDSIGMKRCVRFILNEWDRVRR